LPSAFDPATREALLARVRFYRDLGLTEFYRRPVDPALLAKLEALSATSAGASSVPRTPTGAPSFPRPSAERGAEHEPQASSPPQTMGAPGLASETWESNTSQEDSAIPPRKPLTAPPAIAAAIPQKDRAAALQLIREDIGDCTRCALHTGRNKIVFGDGSPTARLFFVGEGPGADEDAQGIPFVGKAGQLLNNMIAAMGLKREEVYIANVVKCRPPGNRTPEPEEGNTCSPFLFQQIDVVRPQVIVALGATAATYLLGQRQPLAGLRGRVHAWRGMQLIITYHPAFLLRDPRQKKEAWADLQIAMRELGLKAPAKG
jgi:uracil-DNA glycosylase family 4